jgi:TRAP-type C4-dicarboxylate transport system permease small subunit
LELALATKDAASGGGFVFWKTRTSAIDLPEDLAMEDLGLKELRHIKIASFVSSLAPRPRHLMRALAWLIVLVLMAVLMVQARRVMGIEGRSLSISLPVAVPRSWFYSIPLLVGCASMSLTSVYLILAELTAALTGRPVEADLDAAAASAAEGAEP